MAIDQLRNAYIRYMVKKQEIKEVLLRLDEYESEQVVELKKVLNENTASKAVLSAVYKALKYVELDNKYQETREKLQKLRFEVAELLKAQEKSADIIQDWKEGEYDYQGNSLHNRRFG